MKSLVFSEKSLDDLQSILVVIARDKPIAAVHFVEVLEQQCRSLAQFPEIGIRREDLAANLRLFSFAVMAFITGFWRIRCELKECCTGR